MSFTPSKSKVSFDPLDARVQDAPDFPVQAIPYAVKLLLRRSYRTSFEPPHERAGIDVIARCIVSIYAASEGRTAIAVNQVYRLLDTSFNGTTWAAPGGVPEAIPVVPLSSGYEDSTRGLLQRLLEAVEAGGGGELDPQILAKLTEISLLLV